MHKDRMQLAIETVRDILGAEPIPRDPMIAELVNGTATGTGKRRAPLPKSTAARGLRDAGRARANPSAATMRGKLGN